MSKKYGTAVSHEEILSDDQTLPGRGIPRTSMNRKVVIIALLLFAAAVFIAGWVLLYMLTI